MTRKQFYAAVTAMILAAAIVIWTTAGASDRPIRCWVMCKPGTQVNVRRTPEKKGQVVGYMEVGDDFRTTGESKNGFIRAEGIGEYGEAWIYCGYVVTEEPERIGERYVCTSNGRVACRRWMNGPQVSGRPWITNGSSVDVFYMADGWAVTSRGYIRAEWLEVYAE